MKFHKRQGDRSSFFVKVLIKVALISVLVFAVIIFVDKIDFPTPNKKIEKIIPNENLKVVK
tara:strand:+ start:352 stop:534 length:183 start_codon:yes stop_codon:yes gene_type:complete